MKEENQAVMKALNMYGRVPEMWELLEEIERLNNIIDKKEQFLGDNIKRLEREIVKRDNIIKEIRKQLDYLETYSSKEDVFEDMKRRLDRIDKIIGSDKE